MKRYNGFLHTFLREWNFIRHSPIRLLGYIIIPIICFIVFLTLMQNGLPQKLPTAIVDFDNSAASRKFIRSLNSMESINIIDYPSSFSMAKDGMLRDLYYGFLIIPHNFEKDILSGRQPQISYYTNSSFLVPASLQYKAFKTMSLIASGNVVVESLSAKGVMSEEIMAMVQPINYDVSAIGNPWLNYSVYLSNTLLPGMIQLMVLVMTVFSIGYEIKKKSVKSWLNGANGSMMTALAGKLLPQTILFCLMGFSVQIVMYGYLHFPLADGILPMLVAMLLLIVASQCIGVIISSVSSSLRVGLSVASLLGTLSFSITGFTFPVDAMYAPFKFLASFIPLRHYFLIYGEEALNGAPIFFSLPNYIYLLLYILVASLFLKRLKTTIQRDVYIP